MSKDICNWTFEECLKPSVSWRVTRDCGDEVVLNRGDSRNWRAYKSSLKPHPQGANPPGDICPNCGKHVNGVNPYDDGQTWRR